jgi:hypothetical protein
MLVILTEHEQLPPRVVADHAQFHTEGFVNTYLQQPTADDNTIVHQRLVMLRSWLAFATWQSST